MKQSMQLLSAIYKEPTLLTILEGAINKHWPVYFLSRLTDEYQALTAVQLAGIRRFRRVIILLETGQTYEVGIERVQNRPGTYQEVGYGDLLVDEKTLAAIQTYLKLN